MSLIIAFNQLKTMYSAGIPLQNSLLRIAQGLPSGRVKKAFARLSADLNEGRASSLQEAMERNPKVFSAFQSALVGFGEEIGKMDYALAAIVGQLEHSISLKRQMVSACIYPSILLFMTILLPPVYLFVTQGPAAYFRLVGAEIGVLLVIVLAFYAIIKFGPRGLLESVFTSVPLIGPALKKIFATRFCRTLAHAISGGLNIARSLRMSAEASGSHILKRDVAKGMRKFPCRLSEVLADVRFLPPAGREMIAIGEESGNLDNMMFKLADYMQEEADTTITRVSKVAPVFFLILVACVAAYVVINAWMGYIGELRDLIP